MPRPSKTAATRETQQTLLEAGVYAAKLVRDIVKGRDVKGHKVIRIPSYKLVAAKIAIEHSLGLPKAKIELKTDAMTMKDIAELAAGFDNANGDSPGDDVMNVPTKPLTARQMKERAQNNADN